MADGWPLRDDTILRPIEAASSHWQRGDKALANRRLVFSGLPRLADQAAADRLADAAALLDNGLSPEALMKALWPASEFEICWLIGVGSRRIGGR